MRSWVVLIALMASVCCARGEPPRAVERSIAWRQLGSWSGHGNRQTESFTSESGTLRVRWEATRLPGPIRDRVDSEATPTSGRSPTFRLTAHSAISGRLLQQVVEHGPGSGVDYVRQDPHVFYLIVESRDVNWTFTVEEAIG